jgi:shikimate kinase
MNIVLTGFMGTGKSTVARCLAKSMGLRLLDSDSLISAKASMSIAEIFSSRGEEHFRDLESKVIKELTESGADGVVLSTGGGAVLNAGNRRALKSWGRLVCLTADIDTILKRTGESLERPLLHGDDKRAFIEGLLEERRSAYEDSHIIIDTMEKTVQEVVGEIEAFLATGA